MRNGAIEAIELKCPVMIEARALRQDSGGAGKWRGGLATDLHVRNFVEGRWNLSRPYRRGLAPWGLWGGKGGAIGDYQLRRPGENEFRMTYGHRYLVPANSEVLVRQLGGGGWGDPLERDPGRVRDDVLDELVSPAAARDAYGVVLKGADFVVDAAQTEALRAELRAARTSDSAVAHEVVEGGRTVLLTDLRAFATGAA